ncbi:hypothetical protein CEXT_567451 [Caerostris extrusa]|uniref:Uncharacterized protein n=1 Tax=Caerostris extrusa TaxID=172846 RepID=A0AAV4TDA3_CAEEX|nr:hypothetical protein CEXT_567451 [Caerostris extrusa]
MNPSGFERIFKMTTVNALQEIAACSIHGPKGFSSLDYEKRFEFLLQITQVHTFTMGNPCNEIDLKTSMRLTGKHVQKAKRLISWIVK